MRSMPIDGDSAAVRNYFSVQHVFWFFALLYSLFWGLLPFLLQNNLRPDSVEQFFIGKEWFFSTTKHPQLGAWILETLYFITGTPAATYFCTSLAVFTMLAAFWKLSNEFMPPMWAFFAVLVFANYRYCNIGCTYFLNHTSLLPFYCLTVMFFYDACKTGKLTYWILAGLSIGAGMNCYYPMSLLAISVFIFTLLFSEMRKYWKQLLLTAIIAVILFSPHFLWNIRHGFPTLDYVGSSGAGPYHWYNHIVQPLLFLLASAAMLLPVWLSLFPLWKRCKADENISSTWQRWFLPVMFGLPLALQLCFGILSGHALLSRQGLHLWLLLPLLLVWCLRGQRVPPFRYPFMVMTATALIFAGYYLFEPLCAKTPNDVLFPGRALAAEVERVWHEKYSEPIPYIAGEWKLSGNVAVYGKDRPSVLAFGGNSHFGPSNRCISTWCSIDDLQKGAVVLWTIRNETVPDKLTQYFPNAVVQPEILDIPYNCRWKTFPPLKVGIAIIPPRKGQN